MLAAGGLAALVYGASMCREVYWGDSAELSIRAVSVELSPIARGYPLLRALSGGAARLLGDPALAANLLSVLAGATAAALLYEGGRRLGGSRLAGAVAAGVGGLAHTVWFFAGVAEVYSLHCAILAAMLLLTLDAAGGSRRARVALGVVAGLSLLHHRMIAFAGPGVVACLVAGLWRVPAADRVRRLLEIAAGFVAGVLPFVILCVVASRAPPEGTTDPAAWWFRDVFMGGDANAEHVLGAGKRSTAANALYLVRWIGFCIPGPGLVLAAAGFLRLLRTRRDHALLFGLLLPVHLVFPLRYDWTGDQFAFLTPVYPILALLAAAGVPALADRFGARAAVRTGVAAIVIPPALYVALAWTPLGDVVFPGRTPEARERLVAPWHADERPATTRGRPLLSGLPQGALLHCDWGDGQVFRYLQIVEGLRTDVEVRIWYGTMRPGGAASEWVAALPGRTPLPRAVEAVKDRLVPAGDGLYELKPR